tara:strand:- start:129 stop:860 length:732 start_codon:yes stop_codon:yes gene_type:complete
MFKFFRNIRQSLLMKDKITKYYKYAFGEIVLVVIGILIALSINNWNEARKNRIEQLILINNIIEDLRLDSIHINKSLSEVGNQKRLVDDLISKSLDNEKKLNYQLIGLLRFSSDFRPISQRNHSVSVSNLDDEFIRELLQGYFIEEDKVLDIFLEYVDIIHNKIRPYLSETGMHNLESLYKYKDNESLHVPLHPEILEEQLKNIKFQQLLYERRLKTDSFENLLGSFQLQNEMLINELKQFIE